MQTTSNLSPTYAAAFRCIGPTCEDPCCGEWNIPLDKQTYEKYRQFPPEKLGGVVSQFVSISTSPGPQELYAEIHRAPSGLCPFWGADRLCSIQKEYGPQFLSATCSIYPRSLSYVEGTLEGSLSLSCPEAARNVLLNPNFLQVEGDLRSGAFRTDNSHQLAGRGDPRKPYRSFLPLRALLIEFVCDRSRPLWQRVLLIGILCERLEKVLAAGGDEAVPRFLNDYREQIRTDVMLSELAGIPNDPALKLDVVMKLTDRRLREKTCGKRFRDTFWAFIEGIASSDGSAANDEIGGFLKAEQNYHRPFFERHPYILENYLLNYIFQNLFPVGQEGQMQFAPRSIFNEYVLMATQFAWINALLIGVAGSRKQAFSGQDVVHTVQSFSREVEHYPPVLNSIVEYMTEREMNTLQGMAIMLRN